MGKSESSKKAIAMTIITALVTRALKKKNDKKHELVTADSKELTEKDLWRPLQPIGTNLFSDASEEGCLLLPPAEIADVLVAPGKKIF